MSHIKEFYQGKWNYPTTIQFGIGKIKQLPQYCAELGIQRPLLVTDPFLATTPMVKEAVQANVLKGLHTGVFSNLQGNPTGQNVEEGLEVYTSGQHDGVIAFGGGSAMDVAKTIAIVAGQNLHWTELEDKGDNYLKANANIIPPIIAIPTTAGTGSEVGRAALIIDEKTRSKKIIFHPKMLPTLVISDPELTVGVPPHLTAATGMDALAHCLEAYCAKGFHPMADGIALEGMRLIKQWLPVAYQEPKNLEARSAMMVAATMGATAFQKGLGAIHSLSHPVGALYGAHHGLLNAIFMPYVLEYNRAEIESKMVRLAQYLELESQSLDGVIGWVHQLLGDLHIPKSLAEIEVDENQVDEIVRQALADGSTPSNTREMDAESVKQLLIHAIRGVNH